MNKVILMGRLTADPEIRYTQDQKVVASYTLAVDRWGNDKCDFFRCQAWDKRGEFAEKYLRKGMKIAITGRIQNGSYTDRDGRTVHYTDIVVDEQEFCESRKEYEARPQAKPQAKPQDDGFMDIPEDIDDELPFN